MSKRVILGSVWVVVMGLTACQQQPPAQRPSLTTDPYTPRQCQPRTTGL